MNYREEIKQSEQFKRNYLDSLDTLIQFREQQAETDRAEYVKQIFENPKKYRGDFRKMLGWPLTDHTIKGLPSITAEKLSQEDGYTIYRMQFTILEGFTMTGLFFQLDGGKKPLVIVQHGGDGTPEYISGFYGSTAYYHDMLQRVLKQGVHVFAPQLLLWDDTYQAEYDRKAVDARLKRVGSSIAAVEIYGIMRIIDYFQQQDYVSNFGMLGLSYGGFYTLYTAAIDTRIKSAVSCAFFNQRDRYPFSDWTWFNSAKLFDDAEVACLIYPRRLCIEIGDKDALFDCRYGIKAYEKLQTMCHTVGTDWLNLVVYDGIHEFCKEDAPIEQMAQDLKNMTDEVTK